MSIKGHMCDQCGKEKSKQEFEPLRLEEITDSSDGSKLRKVIEVRMGASEYREKKIPNFDLTGKLLEPNTIREISKTPDNFDFCQECVRNVLEEILGLKP